MTAQVDQLSGEALVLGIRQPQHGLRNVAGRSSNLLDLLLYAYKYSHHLPNPAIDIRRHFRWRKHDATSSKAKRSRNTTALRASQYLDSTP